jgi:hypothetical protein
MAVFVGAVFVLVILMTVVGYLVVPERREHSFLPLATAGDSP